MAGQPFTVQTFNCGDVAAPGPATFTHLTERPPRAVLERELGYHGIMYPPRGTDAAIYDPKRLKRNGDKVEQAWESGRDHGHPGTTPDGFVLSWWGLLDEVELVAFVCSHLVNNAFGEPIRGERALRLLLWWQGWRAMTKEARRLRKLGYRVFKLGDFNRRPRFWPKILQRSIGVGYDRIIWPAAVELLESWRGARNGSDHTPLVGRFRFR